MQIECRGVSLEVLWLKVSLIRLYGSAGAERGGFACDAYSCCALSKWEGNRDV